MNGKVNRPYDRKYWSSLMYINCAGGRRLTPETVSQAHAGDLHSFLWTDKLIGSLPLTYNMMVGYYSIPNPKAVHFTDGGPWLDDYKKTPYADEWNEVWKLLRH